MRRFCSASSVAVIDTSVRVSGANRPDRDGLVSTFSASASKRACSSPVATSGPVDNRRAETMGQSACGVWQILKQAMDQTPPALGGLFVQPALIRKRLGPAQIGRWAEGFGPFSHDGGRSAEQAR